MSRVRVPSSALALLDDDLEPVQVDLIRGQAQRLPESVTAGLVELLGGDAGAGVRDRTAYVLGSYRREFEALGL